MPKLKSTPLAFVIALFTIAVIPTQNAWADNHDDDDDDSYCDTEPLQNLWEPNIIGTTLSGKGKVCLTPQGLKGDMTVRGLAAGNAYTVWWVYIDRPDLCIPFWLDPPFVPFPEPRNYAGNCSFVDFFTPDPSGEFLDPLVVFGRMDSVIPKGKGMTKFSGTVRSMQPSPGSQVWMLIFGHGPADMMDRRQLARQLLTPEDPGSGTPHLGIDGRFRGYPSGVVVITLP